MVDSVIDLVSQAILAAAERASASRDARFPVGRARMSAVGVASAAGIMLGATLLVVQASASDLYFGIAKNQRPDLRLGPLLYSILGGAILVKGALYGVCAAAERRAPPGRADTLSALKDDHFTDVLANSAALLAGLFAARAWWADPAAAILLSLYSIAVWSRVFKGQVEKIVGKGADAETMSKLEAIAAAHDTERVFVDVIRAWHAGERIFTEVEIVSVFFSLFFPVFFKGRKSCASGRWRASALFLSCPSARQRNSSSFSFPLSLSLIPALDLHVFLPLSKPKKNSKQTKKKKGHAP